MCRYPQVQPDAPVDRQALPSTAPRKAPSAPWGMAVSQLANVAETPRTTGAAADLYGESYVNVFGSGPSAKVEPTRLYHQAFPDLHLDIEDLIVAGDTVVLDKVVREWIGADKLGLFIQLGVLDDPWPNEPAFVRPTRTRIHCHQ